MRETRRGGRIDKAKGRNNDGVVALLMALDRAEHKPVPARLPGWL